MSDTEKQSPTLAELKAKREARIKAQQAEIAKARDAKAVEDEIALEGILDTHSISRIRILETPLGLIVVRAPESVLFKAYQDKGDTRHETMIKVVQQCLVYPSADRFHAIIEQYPAVTISVMGLLLVLAGGEAEEVSLKSEG